MFKKISAVGVSCMTALVLVLSVIASPASVSAVTLEEMANAAISCIISHEGTYNSVNANDCGAVSVGKLQWHADRALNLMRDICELCPSYAQTTLGSSLYNEIMSASTSWSYRTFSSAEAQAAAVLLGSDYGIEAQDALASKDVQNYIITGQNKGITDPGALVLYADIYNFGCGIAARIAKRAASYAGSYSAVTLDNMYDAALDDAYGSNSAFVSRTKKVYNSLLTYDWSDDSTSATTTPAVTTVTTTATAPVIEFTEEGAGTYTVDATSLNLRSGPGTGYSIITAIPDETKVTVTATGGGWAAVTYNGYEGYCSMDYLALYVETDSAESETTTTTAVTTTAETTTETTVTTTTAVSEETTTTTASTAVTTEETTTTTTTTATTAVTTAEPVETTTEEAVTTTKAVTTTVINDVIVNSSYATLYGDVNCDGSVNVADAVLLHKYISGAVQLNVEQIANGDCSYDSALSSSDVIVIMQHLVGHFTALPIL